MIKLNRILECVADKCAVNAHDVTGRSRIQNIREARFIFCLITRELTRMPYSSIGNYIDREHCTVLHAIKRANELIDVYPEMKSLYNEIKHEISME